MLQLSYYIENQNTFKFNLKFYLLTISRLKIFLKHFKYFVLHDTIFITYLCNVK